MNGQMDKPVYLVINADDFGYFASVSRGIVACARQGAITATGVMANGPHFDEIVPWLDDLPQIDVGVHLNITYGQPVSKSCRRKLMPLGGYFFPKAKTAALILQKKLPVSVVKDEWRAQIERCLAAGLSLRFVNTHEHIHILPRLVGVIVDLAREYKIEAIRFPRTEWKAWPQNFSAVIRNLLFLPINMLNGTIGLRHCMPVIGIGISGKLSLSYLSRRIATLERGKVYELMCHPGMFDPSEILDKRLCRFHAWQQEFEVLTNDDFKKMLQRFDVRVQRYRDLQNVNLPLEVLGTGR